MIASSLLSFMFPLPQPSMRAGANEFVPATVASAPLSCKLIPYCICNNKSVCKSQCVHKHTVQHAVKAAPTFTRYSRRLLTPCWQGLRLAEHVARV